MSDGPASPAGLPSYNSMLEDVHTRARVKVARSHFPISQLNVESEAELGVVDTKARNEFRENMDKLRQMAGNTHAVPPVVFAWDRDDSAPVRTPADDARARTQQLLDALRSNMEKRHSSGSGSGSGSTARVHTDIHGDASPARTLHYAWGGAEELAACTARDDAAAAKRQALLPQQAVEGRFAGITICATGGRDTSGAKPSWHNNDDSICNAADAAAANIERRAATAAEACARAMRARDVAGGPARLNLDKPCPYDWESAVVALPSDEPSAAARAAIAAWNERLQQNVQRLADSCAGKAASWDDDAPPNFAFAAPGCKIEPLSAWRTRGAAGLSPTATEKSAVERVLKAKQAYGLVGHGRLAASVAAAANGNGGGAGALAEEMKQEAESGKAAKRKTKGKGKGKGKGKKATTSASAETATQEEQVQGKADASAENGDDSAADTDEWVLVDVDPNAMSTEAAKAAGVDLLMKQCEQAIEADGGNAEYQAAVKAAEAWANEPNETASPASGAVRRTLRQRRKMGEKHNLFRAEITQGRVVRSEHMTKYAWPSHAMERFAASAHRGKVRCVSAFAHGAGSGKIEVADAKQDAATTSDADNASPPSLPWGTNADVPGMGGVSKPVVPRGRNHDRPFELGPSNPVHRNQRWNTGVRTPKQSEHRRAFRSPSSVQGLILR